MNRQAGWSLLEMVLTMTVMVILLGGIGLSVSRPIQDVFYLNEKVALIKPMHLAVAHLQQSLKKATNLALSQDKSTLSIQSFGQDLAFSCQANTLTVSHMAQTPGVLLYGYDCRFDIFEQETAWVVMIYVKPSQDTQAQTMHRLYYVSKEAV